MKALVIAPRFPWPPHTGERLRATIWLSALSRTAEVTLVAPRGHAPADVRFVPAERSLADALLGAMAIVLDRLPFQCMLSAPYDWRAAIARARSEHGPFDVTIVLLSRMHPWVRESLDGRAILDAVDSLRRNAEERWKAAPFATRWLWRMEQRRLARLEAEASRIYERVVVVSEDETIDFGHAVAITNGIATHSLNGVARTFDFGFWGRLPYFANADAVRWILNEIWPAIRARRPHATLVIGGAEASAAMREAARREGVTVVSPIDDVPSFARTIRVALMPLRYGSGQSNKILEAAEAGCGIVGTPQAMRGLGSLVPFTRIESEAEAFARAAVELLADDARRAMLASQLRTVVETNYARSVTLERLSRLAEVPA